MKASSQVKPLKIARPADHLGDIQRSPVEWELLSSIKWAGIQRQLNWRLLILLCLSGIMQVAEI